jgi:hypothetical protein
MTPTPRTPGFTADNRGIAYGVSLAVVTIFMLAVCWVTMAPMVDGLRDVTVEANANDPGMFSNDLVSRVNNIYNIWGYIVFSFVAVPFLYVIVRAIRQQSLQE